MCWKESAKRPQLERALHRLEELGALRAMMTGSGSVVYGLFGSEGAANAALSGLDKEKGFRAVTCREAVGVEMIRMSWMPASISVDSG